MSVTSQLPTPPSTARPTTFQAEADAFLGALPQFQTELNTFADSVSQYGRNLIDNAAFQVAQRFTASTAVSDDSYALDRWNILTQTASVNVSQLTDPEDGYTYAMRLTQNQSSAQRMGFSQIIEGKRCKHLRGNSGALTARVRISNSQVIRYAILGWTGTEDNVTSDVVNSWTNSTFTTGNFFNSTTLSLLAIGSQTPPAATWTTLAALTGSLGSSFNNLIIFIWTEATAAQNVTLDVDFVQLEAGTVATPLERVHYQDALARCQRYYRRIVAGTGPYTAFGCGMSIDTTHTQFSIAWSPMRVPPSMTFSTGFTATDGVTLYPVTGLVVTYTGTEGSLVQLTNGGGGMTQYRPCHLTANNLTTSYLELNSEL